MGTKFPCDSAFANVPFSRNISDSRVEWGWDMFCFYSCIPRIQTISEKGFVFVFVFYCSPSCNAVEKESWGAAVSRNDIRILDMNGNLGAAIVTVLIFSGLETFMLSKQIDMCQFLNHYRPRNNKLLTARNKNVGYSSQKNSPRKVSRYFSMFPSRKSPR